METEGEMSRYEVTPVGIFLETFTSGKYSAIKHECIMPRECFVEAYNKWIKNAPTEKMGDKRMNEVNAETIKTLSSIKRSCNSRANCEGCDFYINDQCWFRTPVTDWDIDLLHNKG